MKSVGEVMAIGRIKEALQKAVRSLEQDRPGSAWTTAWTRRRSGTACGCRTPDRLLYLAEAMRRGLGARRSPA